MGNMAEERIKNVMSSVFEISVDQIRDDSSPDTIGSWDSLKHMNLVVALEEEFGVIFNDEELSDLENFMLIKFILEEKLNKR